MGPSPGLGGRGSGRRGGGAGRRGRPAGAPARAGAAVGARVRGEGRRRPAEAGGRDVLGPCCWPGDALTVSPGEGLGPGQPSWVGRGRRWGQKGAPGASIAGPSGAGASSLGRPLSVALTRWGCRGETGGGWGGPCGSFVCPASRRPGRGGPQLGTCRAPIEGVGEKLGWERARMRSLGFFFFFFLTRVEST